MTWSIRACNHCEKGAEEWIKNQKWIPAYSWKIDRSRKTFTINIYSTPSIKKDPNERGAAPLTDMAWRAGLKSSPVKFNFHATKITGNIIHCSSTSAYEK